MSPEIFSFAAANVIESVKYLAASWLGEDTENIYAEVNEARYSSAQIKSAIQ
jgi:hypothetical protein